MNERAWGVLILLAGLTLYLFKKSLAPAVILGGVVWFFDPQAAVYTAVSAFVWEFLTTARMIRIEPDDEDDDEGDGTPLDVEPAAQGA